VCHSLRDAHVRRDESRLEGGRSDSSGTQPLAGRQGDWIDVRGAKAGKTRPALTVRGPAPVEAGPGPQAPARARSPLAASVLSFVWPGLGELYLRRRVSALVFAVPTGIVILWLLALLAQGRALFLGSFIADPAFALVFTLVIVLFGLWRAASMVHAYVLAAPRRRPRALDSAVLAALALAILLSHVVVARTSWSVFVFDTTLPNNRLLDAEPTVSADPNEQYVAEPTATPVPWQPGSTYAAPRPTWTITPPPAKSNRVTVLLVGVDWTTGRAHTLMDSLMVVSLNTKTRQVAMVSVPRDTANYEFYWGGNAGVNTKINSFYNSVRAKLIPAPDAPLVALKNEIGWLVGVRVDYYAIIDLHSFRVLVDMVGGVCVTNPRAINDPSTGTFIAAGPVCLDGTTALQYVRSREGAGDTDYTRAARQQDVLVALEQKLATPEGLLMLPDVLGLAGTSIQTDFPLKSVNSYIPIAQRIASKDVSKCVLGPPYNYHPPSSETRGSWTSRLKPAMVASLSIYLFGTDSRFYGMQGITPRKCQRA
jgi:LCP family protein required for cell wall assembly